MIFKKAAHVASEMIILSPRLRHQHQHGMGERTAGGDQQFKHIVETRGIALSFRNQRKQFPDIVAEQLACKERFPCTQLVQIAPQGVDLPVMSEITERMREMPRRKRIGAVPLMNQRQRRFEPLVSKIRIKFLQLRGKQQPFIYNTAAGHAADITFRNSLFNQTAHHIQFALEHFRRRESASVDEQLADHGTCLPRRTSDLAGLHGNVAPCNNPSALRGDDLFDRGFPVRSTEEHRNAVFSRFRQFFSQFRAEELIRQSQQKPRTVAGIRIASGGAAMHQPFQDRHSHLHDPVIRHIVQIRHEPDAACVVFVRKAVKSGIGYRGRGESLL